MTERVLKAVVVLVTALAAPAPVLADDGSLAVQIVDALNKAYGAHPGFRANHAKGIVAEGSFEPSREAAKVSRSPLFAGGKLPVMVRFSDASGIPNVHDGSPVANPHGMAIKFHLPSGADTDMVLNSLKVFPVATGEEFRDLNLAIAASPPGAPKPTALDTFVASHPSVPRALGSVSTPASFAEEVYYGIDAFVFTNAAGKEQPVRYVIAPERVVHLTSEEAAKQRPDFIVDELPARLAKGTVRFHLNAQLAAPGDSTKDPTQAWPDDRPVAELGVITVEKVVPDSADAQKKLLFLPTLLTDGIKPSDDPLIALRSAAYSVSFSRRSSAP
ncbi:MAG TPA: catalase family peroxidase [Myxococcota bacterium]|nr:catalase family peroxidase [Myxococcota bacterium]